MRWFRTEMEQDFPPYYPYGYKPKKKGVPCLLLFELIFSIAGIGLGTLMAFWLISLFI